VTYERREEPDRADDHPVDGNCNAKRSNGNGLCRRPAGFGTSHKGYGNCKDHGGTSPNGEKHAANVAQQQADDQALAEMRMAEGFGVWRRPADPAEALMEEIGRTLGNIDYCDWQIRKLDPTGIIWGTVSRQEKHTPDGLEVTVKQAAELNAWYKLQFQERRHLVDTSAKAVTAGVEVRMVELMEQQIQQLAARMKAFAEFLGVANDPRVAAAYRHALGPSITVLPNDESA